ncbi:MAG TPA: DUF4336 domain-containing protein [Leptolyngbyaceae cyanobacterium]
MLRELDRNIWVAEQPFRYFGLSVGTRMTVIRLANQDLAVISPIQVDDETKDQLYALGTVKHIIAPNLYHYLFSTSFKVLCPDAVFWAVPGLKAKKPELPIDNIIGVTDSSLWEELKFLFFDGVKTFGLGSTGLLNECVFFHAASRTLILTDTAFHFDESFPLATQLVTKTFGGYKSLSPTFLERIATTEKEKVKTSAEQILSWDFERVIMAHGSIVEQNGKKKFQQGYEQFLRQSLNAAV